MAPRKTPTLRRYTVRVEREVRHHAEVEVEARDEDHAKELAAAQYDGPHSGTFWREGDVTDETIKVEVAT
jgi:hypothetical protein